MGELFPGIVGALPVSVRPPPFFFPVRTCPRFFWGGLLKQPPKTFGPPPPNSPPAWGGPRKRVGENWLVLGFKSLPPFQTNKTKTRKKRKGKKGKKNRRRRLKKTPTKPIKQPPLPAPTKARKRSEGREGCPGGLFFQKSNAGKKSPEPEKPTKTKKAPTRKKRNLPQKKKKQNKTPLPQKFKKKNRLGTSNQKTGGVFFFFKTNPQTPGPSPKEFQKTKKKTLKKKPMKTTKTHQNKLGPTPSPGKSERRKGGVGGFLPKSHPGKVPRKNKRKAFPTKPK